MSAVPPHPFAAVRWVLAAAIVLAGGGSSLAKDASRVPQTAGNEVAPDSEAGPGDASGICERLLDRPRIVALMEVTLERIATARHEAELAARLSSYEQYASVIAALRGQEKELAARLEELRGLICPK